MATGKAALGTVKAPLGSYPKLWRLIDHYFLKDDPPDRDNVAALEVICDANAAVLANERSVNARTVRGKEAQLLVSTGCVAVLIECGWVYRVQRMEECYVLPYDSDLEALRFKHDKMVETQDKVQARFVAAEQAVRQRKKVEDAEKMRIIRQIDGDRADRQFRQALKSGQPLPQRQSLNEQRKLAVQERLEREKQRKARLAVDAAPAVSTATETDQYQAFPGSFPPAPQVQTSPVRPQQSHGSRSTQAARGQRKRKSALPSETNRLGGAVPTSDDEYDDEDDNDWAPQDDEVDHDHGNY